MSFIQITFYPTPWGFTIPVSILFSLFYLGSCIKLCFSSFRLFQLPFLNNHSHALLLFSSLPIPIIHSKSNFVYVKPRSFFPFLFFFLWFRTPFIQSIVLIYFLSFFTFVLLFRLSCFGSMPKNCHLKQKIIPLNCLRTAISQNISRFVKEFNIYWYLAFQFSMIKSHLISINSKDNVFYNLRLSNIAT